MHRTIALTVAAAALALPAAASAQNPLPNPQQPGDQQPPPQQEPTPPPPAKATLSLRAERVGPLRMVLAGDRWSVAGRLGPNAQGETVTVTLYARGRKVVARSVKTGEGGAFRVRLKPQRIARFSIRATHKASARFTAARSGWVRVETLPRRVRRGSGAGKVRALQRRLRALGYVTGRRGVYDARTGRAVLAMRKVTGMRRTTVADRAVMRRLARGGGRYRLRFPGHGKHVEADLSRQVLVLARGGKVERIYPTSSGTAATPTIRGHFRFYRFQPGTNAKGMVHSWYFIRGYAIHGYASVPIFPASHGCLRVPIPDARSIANWIRRGNRIDVYP